MDTRVGPSAIVEIPDGRSFHLPLGQPSWIFELGVKELLRLSFPGEDIQEKTVDDLAVREFTGFRPELDLSTWDHPPPSKLVYLAREMQLHLAEQQDAMLVSINREQQQYSRRLQLNEELINTHSEVVRNEYVGRYHTENDFLKAHFLKATEQVEDDSLREAITESVNLEAYAKAINFKNSFYTIQCQQWLYVFRVLGGPMPEGW